MGIDLNNTLLHTSFNAFKNNSVQTDTLALPASLTAGATYTDTVTFTLSESAAFIACYVYSTDYDDYFRYLDSAYHDAWRPLYASQDHLVFDDPVTSLFFYDVNVLVDGSTVTAKLYIENTTAGTITYTPNKTVPIAFVDYTLAN